MENSEKIMHNQDADITRALFTEKEYFRALERYAEHGDENAPGFLCVEIIGACWDFPEDEPQSTLESAE